MRTLRDTTIIFLVTFFTFLCPTAVTARDSDMAPLPAELFNCTWVDPTLCSVSPDPHFGVVEPGVEIKAAFHARYPNMYPLKRWAGSAEQTCCMDKYMRSILRPTLTRSAQQATDGPEVVVLSEVLTHAPYKRHYIAWNTSTRFVFDTTKWKFTSLMQDVSSPYIQGEQFIAPSKTVSLARFELALVNTSAPVVPGEETSYTSVTFSAVAITNTESGERQHQHFTRYGTPEIGYHTVTCHHEIHWNTLNKTFFALCAESNSSIYEFDFSGRQVWSFWHEKMHKKHADQPVGLSHVNSLSYDAETDEIVVNELLHGGIFGISRSESKLKWCVGNGDVCGGKYEAGDFIQGQALTFHMHQVHHIGVKRYIAYINQFRVDGKMVQRSGFAFFRWSDSENTMHVSRLWLAEKKMHAPTNGGAVLLPGGDVVLTLCSPSAPSCFLASVRPNDEIAWGLSFGLPPVDPSLMVGASTPNSRFAAIYRVAPKLKNPFLRFIPCVGGCANFEAWPVIKLAAPQFAIVSIFGSPSIGGCTSDSRSCTLLWRKETNFPPHWQPLEFRIDYREGIMHYRVQVTDEWGLMGVVFADVRP